MARCEAVVKDSRSPNFGNQCMRDACTGSSYCAVHGGRDEIGSLARMRKRVDRTRVKCAATNRAGEPCKNFAIRGGTVCANHGGRTGHVKKKAKERLLEMVDPAITELLRIVTKPTTTDADRLRAIQLVLDRTGYHAKTEISAEVKPWEGLVGGEILRDLPDDNVIDAEVVADDDPRDLSDVIRDALSAAEPLRDDLPTDEPAQTAAVVPLESFRNPPAHLR